ncbi:hypothetical protein BH10PLA1_BH10PLA1_03240 [soil metagenome]
MTLGRIRTRNHRIACAVAMVLLLNGGALAQSDDSPVYGVRQRPPTVGFDRINGDLSLTARASSDSDKSSNGGRNTAKELVTEEKLTLNTNGYIVHPNLLQLHLNGTFGLTQDSLSQNGEHQQDNGTLYAWDTSAVIRRNSGAPLTLYSSQSRTLVDRSFGPTLEDTSTTYGALWQIQSKYVPTEFRVYHITETQSALSSNESDFTLDRSAFDWHSEARPTVRQQLDWNYHLESSQQSSASGDSESSDAQSASLSHSISFGQRDASLLNSSVSWSHVTGLFPIDTKRWDETLRLQHTSTFETTYQYTADEQQYDAITQTRQRGVIGFRHRLYDSLITTGRTGWQQISLSDDSQSTDWFDSLDFNYHKKVPHGLLIDTLNLSYDRQVNGATSNAVPIRNEPLVFGSFAPVTIQQQNIVPSSVVIRNAAGQIFNPGDGYTVLPVPGGIQLQPTPGGPFSLNEPLFLFYDIGATPQNVVTSKGLSLSTRYEIQKGWLTGVSPYGRYGILNQTVEGGLDTVLPNSTRSYTYGVDYHIWDFRFKAEREVVDSDLFPYDTNRLEARFDHRVSADTTVSLDSTFTSTNYPVQNDHIETWLISGGASKQISREIYLSGSVSWIDINDDISGRTRGLEESLQLTWQHRQTEVFTRVRNSTLETEQDDRSFQFLEVGIRREF